MPELPRGFISSKFYGEVDLSDLGIRYWARGESTRRNLSLMTTTNRREVVVASCIVGYLQEIASKHVNQSDKPYYDNIFYSMAYLAAQNDMGSVKRLQAPKYSGGKIVYDGTGKSRVFAILTSSGAIDLSDKSPVLVRIAQVPKNEEDKVMGVLSSSGRHS